MSLPAVPAYQQVVGSIIDQAGALKAGPSQLFFQQLVSFLQSVSMSLNNTLGVNYLTFAQVNALTLGPSNVGYIAFVTDYAHFVYWDGSQWQWLDGDRPGRFADFASAPGTGWAVCDGSATTLMGIGATLTATPFTTPNLKGTAAYRKSAASYSGAINAASGSTGTGSTGTGTTGSESSHTHNLPNLHTHQIVVPDQSTGTPSATITFQIGSGVNNSAASIVHTHDVPSQTFNSGTGNTAETSGAGSAHSHSIPALSVPALGVGSLDMPNLGVLPYVRL